MIGKNLKNSFLTTSFLILIFYPVSTTSSKDELVISDEKSSLVSGCFPDLFLPSLLYLIVDIIKTGLEKHVSHLLFKV